MPVWLRKFTFKEINDFYTEQNKEYEKATNQGSTTVMDSTGKVNPANLPHFARGSSKRTSYK